MYLQQLKVSGFFMYILSLYALFEDKQCNAKFLNLLLCWVLSSFINRLWENSTWTFFARYFPYLTYLPAYFNSLCFIVVSAKFLVSYCILQHKVTFRDIHAKFGIFNSSQAPVIGQNSDGGISDFQYSDQIPYKLKLS